LPESKWFATMRCCKDVEEMLKTCKGLAPWYVLPFLQCLRILKQDLFSMFGLSWLTRQNRMSYESANNSRLRFFRNPYDMGRTRNCQEVFGPELKWWGEDGIGLQKKPCPPNEGLSFSAHTVAHFASVLVSHSPLMSIGSSWLTHLEMILTGGRWPFHSCPLVVSWRCRDGPRTQ
jgi:hypothetical protein